jgi:hypothetical protein
MMMKKIILVFAFLLLSNVTYAQQFKVSFTREVSTEPFSGNVYVFLSKNDPEPIKASHWIMMNPVAVAKATKLLPGQQFIINAAKSEAYPVALDAMERGEYSAQLMFDGNYGGRAVVGTVGNYYSAPQKVAFTHDLKKTFSLIADKAITETPFKDTAYNKRIELPSPLLSAFFQKPIKITAVLRLPKEYVEQPDQKFPLKVSISGFGGNLSGLSGNDRPAPNGADNIPFVQLLVDGNCPTGHSGYANSDNNGPWGDALVRELIPYVEQNFRLNGFRFVTGHSSGGWSSLWLQGHYPDAFHGCWSSSPDAIDFRNFEGVNLYTDANAFTDAKGKLLPGMTVGGSNFINYKKDVCAWERIVRSEQYMSFNAVFSGRKADGSIDYLWDFTTGAINPAQREQWRKYDIAHHLVSNWDTLKNKLANKILITTGDADNWALEKAVLLLKKDAEEKKMDIAIQILSGDHFTVFSSDRGKYGTQHTKQRYEAWLSNR